MTKTAAVQKKMNTSIAEKAIILVLTINTFGNHKKVGTDVVTTDADKELLNLTKRLIASTQLSLISALDGEIRRYINSVCLPSPFKNGTYTLPISLVETVEEKMQEFQNTREEYIEALVDAYPQMLREAKDRLRDLYDESDYPTANELRNSFGLTWQYVEFGVGKGLSAEMMRREREKIERQWQDAMHDIRICLRASMADLVSHLVDKLGGKDDGKPKIFRNTTVTNLQEFLQTFDARNIADDAELKKLADKAKKLVSGVDPDLIRKDEDIRQDTQKKFAAIKQQLDKMMVVKPKRGINLE